MSQKVKDWTRTAVLAAGGATGAFAGVLITAAIIHAYKQGKKRR